MAPRSQESQNFFTQLDTAPKFEDLPKEEQKEIIGNPEDWTKIEKPKRVRTKKKKETVKKEPTVLYKYFVEFKINIKGNRKEVGYIVEAESEDKINKLINTRALKDYANFRTLNCVKHRPYVEGDEEYSRDIDNVTRTSSEPLKVESNEDTNLTDVDKTVNALSELAKTMDLPTCWKIVITPGRKPRPKDYDKYYTYEFAASESAAKKQAKEAMLELGISIKDKNIVALPCKLSDVAQTDRFKEFIKNKNIFVPKDLLEEDSKPEPKDDNRPRLAPAVRDNFESMSCQIDNDGFITEIKPDADNIIRQNILNSYTPFYITPIDSIIKYRSTRVLAKDVSNAVTDFVKAINMYWEDETANPSLYRNVKDINVVNSVTKEIAKLGIQYKNSEE